MKPVYVRQVDIDQIDAALGGMVSAYLSREAQGAYSVALVPQGEAQPDICGYCDTAIPEGCAGLFCDAGPVCRLNHIDSDGGHPD